MAWWDDTAGPIVIAAWEALRDTVVGIAVRVAAFWDETVQPAILAAWEWLKETASSIAVAVRAFWDSEGAERVREAWTNFRGQLSDLWVTVRQRFEESTDTESRARFNELLAKVGTGLQDFLIKVSVEGMDALITMFETLTSIIGSIASIVESWMRVRAAFDGTGDSIEKARGALETLLSILEAVPSPWFALEGVLKGIAWAMEQISKFAGSIADWWTGSQPETLPDQRSGVPAASDVPEPQATPTLSGAPAAQRPTISHNTANAATTAAAPLPVAPAETVTAPQSNRIGLNELGALAPTGNAAGGINIQALNVTVQCNGEDAAEQGRIAGRAAMDELQKQARAMAEQADSNVRA